MFVATLVVLAVTMCIFTAHLYRKSRRISTNRCIFISGCDSGIGQKLAWHFDGMGCTVFGGCLNPEVARDKLPQGVEVVPLDVTSTESVSKAINHVQKCLEEQNLELWCLINNAGVCIVGEFEWLTTQQRSRIVNVNLLGTMMLTKSCLPLLRKSKGRIITIGSINGMLSYPGIAVYCATKYGLEAFSDALRMELQQQGIRVILVRPADMTRLTNIMARHSEEMDQMWNSMSPENKLFYGDYFQRYHAATLKNHGFMSPPNFENSPLINDIEHAAFGKHPKTHYLSTPWYFHIMYSILIAMPRSLRDSLLSFVVQKGTSS